MKEKNFLNYNMNRVEKSFLRQQITWNVEGSLKYKKKIEINLCLLIFPVITIIFPLIVQKFLFRFESCPIAFQFSLRHSRNWTMATLNSKIGNSKTNRNKNSSRVIEILEKSLNRCRMIDLTSFCHMGKTLLPGKFMS